MIDLARYRGLAPTLLGLLVCLALLDAALTAAVGFTGRWLPNVEVPTDASVYRERGSKLSALMAEIGKMGPGTDRPLGVLLGQSGLGTDVDARVLEEADGEAMRWENLHGWGSSVNLMVDVSDLLMLSGLKPNVVILGLSPVLLVGTNFAIQHPLLARQQGKWIKPWIWTYNNRLVVNHGTRLITNRIKLWLCRRFGFGLPAIYPPKPDTAPPTRRRVPRESARAEALRLETYEKVGWFDPGHYSPSSSNSRSLVKIIRDCRRLGATVGIVLMPETSLMRRLTPAEAVDLF